MKNQQRRMAFAFPALIMALFVDYLGYAFIVPILPAWQHQFGFSATQATLLVSIWAVPMFLLGPLTGRLTDKIGCGKTILLSLILLSISALMYLVATEELLPQAFLILAGARLLHGASGAAVMTACLASASQLWPNKFGEQAGKLIAMAAIGGLLGPVLGGVLFQYFGSVAFVVLSIATLSAVPVVWYSSSVIGDASEPAQGNVSLKVFITNPVLLRVGILIGITTLATGALEAGGPLFLNDELGLKPAAIGGVLLVMVFTQGIGSLFWGKLVDKNGPTRYMLMGWVVVTISLAMVGVLGHQLTGKQAIIAMILMLGIYQFSIAATQIPMLTMIDAAANQAYGSGNPGLAFGAFGTAWAAGTIVGPLIVGPVYDLSGSWPLSLGLLCVPALFGFIVTFRNQDILNECYNTEMNTRIELE
ncbi:MAG: MFS transporter [Candidatus Poseidoniaceae archaeon]|nr:MFS transporter [Candidatus Poseidoniaceae archaeon]